MAAFASIYGCICLNVWVGPVPALGRIVTPYLLATQYRCHPAISAAGPPPFMAVPASVYGCARLRLGLRGNTAMSGVNAAIYRGSADVYGGASQRLLSSTKEGSETGSVPRTEVPYRSPYPHAGTALCTGIALQPARILVDHAGYQATRGIRLRVAWYNQL
eukprot:96888-Rhodomonas_salina.1